MIDVTLSRQEQLTDDIFSFWFAADIKPRYTAGQFTEIYLPHDNPDSRGQKRWFTLSSSPGEELLAITTRINKTTGSRFKQKLSSLKPGDKFLIAEPMGDFVLPITTDTPITFITAGIGITPVRSMIKSLIETGQTRDINLLHIISKPEDAVFSDIFNSYKMKYQKISRAELDLEQIIKDSNQDRGGLIYLSGPEQMVEDLNKDLIQKGVSPNRLVNDYFHGY